MCLFWNIFKINILTYLQGTRITVKSGKLVCVFSYEFQGEQQLQLLPYTELIFSSV